MSIELSSIYQSALSALITARNPQSLTDLEAVIDAAVVTARRAAKAWAEASLPDGWDVARARETVNAMRLDMELAQSEVTSVQSHLDAETLIRQELEVSISEVQSEVDRMVANAAVGSLPTLQELQDLRNLLP